MIFDELKLTFDETLLSFVNNIFLLKNKEKPIMKKLLSSALAVLACTAVCASTALVAAAEPVDGIEHCYYNYNCYKSLNDVKIDGVYDEAEWADAEELIIDADHMIEAGRWQSSGEPNPASEFSCTYRFKWDETYLYVLEVRTDAHYVSDFAGNDTNPDTPWMLDGTAIFFCDNELPDQSNRCDIKWYSYVDELKRPTCSVAGVNLDDNPNAQMAGSVNGDKVVFELKFPWSIIDDKSKLESPVVEGKVFRFTPIIMNRDTVDDYDQWDGSSSSYRQINFHDCVDLEGVSGAEDPNYWAAMTMCGTKPESTTEAAPETETAPETEAETEPETVAETEHETVAEPATEPAVETAPQTFDITVISAVAAAISLAGFAVTKKH